MNSVSCVRSAYFTVTSDTSDGLMAQAAEVLARFGGRWTYEIDAIAEATSIDGSVVLWTGSVRAWPR